MARIAASKSCSSRGAGASFSSARWQPHSAAALRSPGPMVASAAVAAQVGGIPTPLKNMTVSWDDYPIYYGK